MIIAMTLQQSPPKYMERMTDSEKQKIMELEGTVWISPTFSSIQEKKIKPLLRGSCPAFSLKSSE